MSENKLTIGSASFCGLKNKDTEPIRIYRTFATCPIKLSGKGNTANNNKMERINGEIRDRKKVMRGLKIKETPIL